MRKREPEVLTERAVDIRCPVVTRLVVRFIRTGPTRQIYNQTNDTNLF